jgi:hypothetical protein
MTTNRSSGASGAVNRIGLLDALRGLPFPATRNKLAEHFRHNDADEATIHAIERLEDRRYASATQVADMLGADIPSSAAQGSAPHAGEPQSAQARPAPLVDATRSIATLPGSER